MNENQQQINSDNLELATIGSRVKAFVIDDILITLVFIMLYWEKFQATDDMMALLVIMNEGVYQVLLLKFIYQGFFVWYYGATLGKIFAKIRVIDYNHFGRVSLITSFIRSFFRIISEMFFYIGFILAFFNDSKQTLQDKIAKTLVINA
ncbi:MAG: RDD family protein [Arcobacteraceae bacterium]|nr:RDD family protein [Arcobacteraceae bacterium]